jgi:hypothetical protein
MYIVRRCIGASLKSVSALMNFAPRDAARAVSFLFIVAELYVVSGVPSTN